ncbi:MAG: hypothetical protein QNK37_27870 [Acidobacteriota bacterium]|nr:hypothetical protein [Acidobacteriota bacterium]
MSTCPNTKIVVRVQAKGGKFLGDDIGGAHITIRNTHTKELLASGFTAGDSGDLSTEYSPYASQRVIMDPVLEIPVIQWLSAKPTTSKFIAELSLQEPTLLEISARGPLAGLQTAHSVTATQWVVPGQHIERPGFVLELPGLIVQIMEPQTHLQVTKVGTKIPFKVKVAMMCGCPIKTGGSWPESDFDVSAQIRHVCCAHVIDRVHLTFDSEDGTFNGSYTVPEIPKNEDIYWSATVCATQYSTGNTGAGLVTFFS